MSQVAEILPYRTPFGTENRITLEADVPYDYSYQFKIKPDYTPDTDIRKLIITSLVPGTTLSIANTIQRASKSDPVTLPIQLLLKPKEQLYFFSPVNITITVLEERY